MTALDAVCCAATALFAASYLARQPRHLRRIQAGAACLWVVYGIAIGARPVIAANILVAGAALWSSWVARSRGGASQGPGE